MNDCKDFVLRNMLFIKIFLGQKRESSEGVTVVYRSMWRIIKGKKIEVAMKVLKRESCDKHLKVSNVDIMDDTFKVLLTHEL